MPRHFRLTLTIEDEVIAEDIDDAWDTFKTRVEDRYYGPTVRDLEDLGEVTEEGE